MLGGNLVMILWCNLETYANRVKGANPQVFSKVGAKYPCQCKQGQILKVLGKVWQILKFPLLR